MHLIQAFDVIVDKERRREYDRLGEQGVKALKNTVIDHRYIIIQMIVYYCSSMIFAFIMTFSEASGDALTSSLFGLASKWKTRRKHLFESHSIPCLSGGSSSSSWSCRSGSGSSWSWSWSTSDCSGGSNSATTTITTTTLLQQQQLLLLKLLQPPNTSGSSGSSGSGCSRVVVHIL